MSHTPRSDATAYRIPVRDLMRRPGAQRQISEHFPVPVELGTDVIGIAKGTEADLDVRCEVVTDGMWVSGTFRSEAVGECSRCLDDVRLEVEVPVQGLFLYPGTERVEGDDSDDVYEIEGDAIDLEPVVTDAVVTALPFRPLCSPDCQGLCDQCGARLADDPDHQHEVLDPRWSALEGIKDSIGLSEKKES